MNKTKQQAIVGELSNEWWYGPTGTGKSTRLWTEYPEHYQKAINKWWDGYDMEDVVAIEEWNPDSAMLANKLKIWADRWPFTGEIKNGTVRGIRPKKIIILSNYSIDQCFPRKADAAPLKRRFKVIHFPSIFRPINQQYVQATEEEEKGEDIPSIHPDYNIPKTRYNPLDDESFLNSIFETIE